ncbi:MAG TPA: hypothetical protein PK728_09775 [Bacillota bacterium]|nr:hypothetical protein [Bacillota bacterium]
MSTVNQGQVINLQEYRDIKAVVAENIRAFIKSGSPRARQAMHVVTNAVMKNHNKTRMVFGSFEVIRNNDFGITIRARKHASRRDMCPTCEYPFRGNNVTLVQVQKEGYCHDLVAWGCRRCGEIFTRVEHTRGEFDA